MRGVLVNIEAVKTLFDQSGMSQAEFGEKIAMVKQKSVSRMLSGGRIERSTLENIAKHFNVPVKTLFIPDTNRKRKPRNSVVLEDNTSGWIAGSAKEKLKAYLANVVQEFGQIKPTIIDRVENFDVPLAQLFIKLRFSTTEYGPEREIATGLGVDETAVLQNKKFLIQARGGMGKSTEVAYLACEYADPKRMSFLPASRRAIIPLPMILRALSLETGTWESLLKAYLSTELGKPINKTVLEAELQAGRVMVLLDGLDEIKVDQRPLFFAAIHDGMMKYPECQWGVTTRVMGFDIEDLNPECDAKTKQKLPPEEIEKRKKARKENLQREYSTHKDVNQLDAKRQDHEKQICRLFEFATYYVLPFNKEQQVEFAQKWFELRMRSLDRTARAVDFLEAIKKNENVKQLARVPYLLTLCAAIFRKTAILPNDRVDLYNRIIDAYIEKIQSDKKLDSAKFPLDHIKLGLAAAAFELQCRRQPEKSGTNKQPPLALLWSELHGYLKTGIARAAGHSQISVNALAELTSYITMRAGLIQEVSNFLTDEKENKYAFIHLSFQEVLAAYYIAHWVLDEDWWEKPKERPKGLLIKDLNYYTTQPHWSETLLLVFEWLAEKQSATRGRRLAGKIFPFLLKSDWEDVDMDAIRLTTAIAQDQGIRGAGWHTVKPLDAKLTPQDLSQFTLACQATEGYARWLIQKKSKGGNTFLDLDNTAVTDTGLPQLPKNLTALGLSNTAVTDAGLPQLPKNLTALDLDNTAVTDAGLPQLPKNLTELGLDNTAVTDAGLPQLPPNLTTLDLDNTVVTDAGLTQLSKNLFSLSLNNTTVTDAGLPQLPENLAQLALGNTAVTDAGIAHLPKNLTWLSLTGTTVTDAGLPQMPENLAVLNLSYTAVTDAGVAALKKRIGARLTVNR